MKKAVWFILIISFGFSQKAYDVNHIFLQKNLFKKKFSDELINGSVYQMFDDQKVDLGKIKNGRLDGKWKFWYASGSLQEERSYRNGTRIENWIRYKEDGDKVYQINYHNNSMISEIINFASKTKFIVKDNENFTIISFEENDTFILSNGEIVDKKYHSGSFISLTTVKEKIGTISMKMPKKVKSYFTNGKINRLEFFKGFDDYSIEKKEECGNGPACKKIIKELGERTVDEYVNKLESYNFR